MSRQRRTKKFLSQLAMGMGLLFSASSYAGISYSLIENQAASGETVPVRAILFNDGSNELTWTPLTI